MLRRSDVLVGLLLAAILCGPAVLAGDLVGSAGAETPGHAWVQAWAAAGWPAWPTGTELALGTGTWPVIDPLPTWIAAGVARLVGLTAAWNLLVVGWIVLAAVGGGALARAAGGVGLFGAVGVPLLPIWLGSLASGLSEDGAVGLLALVLAALLEGRPRRAGALLGLLAWCGLYLAWLGAAAAVVLGVRALVRPPTPSGRGALLRDWGTAAALALLLALPAAAPFRARLTGDGHHAGTPPVQVEPRWRLNPVRRADLAAFFTPGKEPPGPGREHPTYVGWTTLGLAAAGGWNPAWLGVAALGAVALDEPVFVAGAPRLATNPVARLFARLPLADRFNHRARLWILGDLILVALAARGLTRLRDRWAGPLGARAVPCLGVALSAVELLAFAPSRVPLPGLSPVAPTIYATLADLPAGPVVVEGAVGPGVNPQRVLFDQRAHGRRLLVDPNRPGPPGDCHGCVVVALGEARARVEAARGPPDRATADGAAWWVDPAGGAQP